MTDVRTEIVATALRMVAEKKADFNRFDYTEGPLRMSCVHKPWCKPTIHCDCSATITYDFAWNGAPDPNGLNYDGEGYTGTELTHGEHIAAIMKNGSPVRNVRAGDVIVYGPYPGWHTALVVDVSNPDDPLTVSMGWNGEPALVYVSQDGRLPQTYLRFSTRKIGPVRKAVRKRRHVRGLPRPVKVVTPEYIVASAIEEAKA